MHLRSTTIPLALAALVVPGCTAPTTSEEAWTFSLTRECFDAYAGYEAGPEDYARWEGLEDGKDAWLAAVIVTLPLSLAVAGDLLALPVTVPRDLVVWIRQADEDAAQSPL